MTRRVLFQVAGYSIAAVMAMTLLNMMEGTKPADTPPAPAQPVQDSEACRTKLIEAQRLDVLADLDWKSPKEPKVVVGPTFHGLPFEAKEGFARTVNCFLLGGEGRFISFNILDHLNHRVLGRWEYGRLKMQ